MEEKIESILTKLSEVQVSVDNLSRRVSTLETQQTVDNNDRSNKQNDQYKYENTANVLENNNSRALLDLQNEAVGPSVNIAADVQRDFERIRDSLLRVPVQNNLKVRDNPTGIKQECKPTLKILSKCARYAEVMVKVLSTRNAESEEENIDKLFTCVAAQINFLQSEFTNLVVKSSFDENTSRIFRQFENNTGIFNEQALNSIRVAAELSSVQNRTLTGPRSNNNRSRGYSSGRFGTNHRGFYRGRGYNSYNCPPFTRTGVDNDDH